MLNPYTTDTYLCGDLMLTIQRLPIYADGRSHWQYSALLDGQTIASGDGLTTAAPWSTPKDAAQALLTFLVGAGSEARQEWGWTFDADALEMRLETGERNDRETIYKLRAA